jgi:uncharacterized membrane protein HdeD (DUF308 family)
VTPLDIDLIFVLGLLAIAFGVPALVSAYADRRWPKLALLLFVVGVLSVAYARQENPGTYTMAAVPDVVVTVIGRYFN